MHALGLKNSHEWKDYCAGRRPNLSPKPSDIPSDAYGVYGQEYKDKGGDSGWLGTKHWRSDSPNNANKKDGQRK